MPQTLAQKARTKFLALMKDRTDPWNSHQVSTWMSSCDVGGVVFTPQPEFVGAGSPRGVMRCGFCDGSVLALCVGPWSEWELNRMSPSLKPKYRVDHTRLFLCRAQTFACWTPGLL